MTTVEKSALVPYSASDMYSLVDDVKRYPEFLPWCGGAKVQRRDDETIVATLHIDYKIFYINGALLSRKKSMRMTIGDCFFS